MATPYAKGEHLKTVLGYLENIERLAVNVKTIEDWTLASVDLIDNVKAAITLVKCQL